MCVFAKWSAYEVSVKMKWLTVLQLIAWDQAPQWGKKAKNRCPFPLPRLPLGFLFFANPDFFSFFPQCGALSQASLVIIFLEPQAPLWTLSDWATITLLAVSSLCSFARVSPLETACRLSKTSLYQANKEGDTMVSHRHLYKTASP